jgi:hypothetical protein
MPGLRDHEPFVIENFNGLWRRGDEESAPSDHFVEATNIQYFHSGFKTRDPIDKYQEIASPLGRILRVYTYVMQTGESLLILVEGGHIYHAIGATTLHGPILSITGMTDFGFVAYNGRAYITPFTSTADSLGVNTEKGMQNQFLYVYKGDGTAARKAAGPAPTNSSLKPFIAFVSQTDGAVTKGVHLIAVCFNGGALGPTKFQVVEAPGDKQIQLTNIPIGPIGTTSRTICMTRAIDPKDYIADQTSYTYYNAVTIADNTTESIKINVRDTALTVPHAIGAGGPIFEGMTVFNTDTEGYCDFGFHLIGVVYETDTGYMTAPGPEFFAATSFVDIRRKVSVSNIPVSPNSYVTKRHLVATKWIPDYNGDQKGYQFFFIPGGTINDNTTTTWTGSFFDSDLISDASHLIDNFAEIPAMVGLTTYHGRLVGWGEYDNPSVARVSAVGEPEAISQVDGLITVPLDGKPITNGQEFRDVLYLFKQTRTYAYADNGDVPSSWQVNVVDQGVGAPVHGIATVLDSGGVNIDYLIICDYSGIMLFNGTYARPELSWKIEDLWFSFVRNDFRYIQIVNDSLNKKIWLTLPPPVQHKLLHMDYGNGLDAKSARFAEWQFDANISSITLIDTDKLIIGALEEI